MGESDDFLLQCIGDHMKYGLSVQGTCEGNFNSACGQGLGREVCEALLKGAVSRIFFFIEFESV